MPIAEALIVEGFEVVIGYGEAGDVDPKLLVQRGLKIHCVPMNRGGTNPLKELRTLYSLWRFFREQRPDIVHLVTIKPYLYGGVIARLTRVPRVVSALSGLGSLFVHNNLWYRFLRFLLYPIYRLALNHPNQRVIVQNKDDAKVLLRWGVLNSKKIRLLKGSGIKLEEFVQLDEPDGIPVVCFVGRLLRDKGVYDFVSAARLLKKRSVQARFYLVGDLDLKNPTGLNIEDLNNLKKEGIVEVLGYQKDIIRVYAQSHIVCLPSYREGLPKALIEASAASRAIVTTDVPGCRDAIISNKTGLLVPVKDPQKLAGALQWLIENPQKRVAMGKAGRELAEKEFRIEKIVREHLDIYDELLNKIK
jgi:glycosyltransferase involved in cell wall biosynthesis